MVGFVIAFAVTLPFMFVHTYKLRHGTVVSRNAIADNSVHP